MRQALYLDPCPWCHWLCDESDPGAIVSKEVRDDGEGGYIPIGTRVFCSKSCETAYYGL